MASRQIYSGGIGRTAERAPRNSSDLHRHECRNAFDSRSKLQSPQSLAPGHRRNKSGGSLTGGSLRIFFPFILADAFRVG
jgi:hypothetical protein